MKALKTFCKYFEMKDKQIYISPLIFSICIHYEFVNKHTAIYIQLNK